MFLRLSQFDRLNVIFESSNFLKRIFLLSMMFTQQRTPFSCSLSLIIFIYQVFYVLLCLETINNSYISSIIYQKDYIYIVIIIIHVLFVLFEQIWWLISRKSSNDNHRLLIALSSWRDGTLIIRDLMLNCWRK